MNGGGELVGKSALYTHLRHNQTYLVIYIFMKRLQIALYTLTSLLPESFNAKVASEVRRSSKCTFIRFSIRHSYYKYLSLIYFT